MPTRFARRPLVVGFLLAVAIGGLTGCRTSPDVAAYVGSEQITVTELQSALDLRRENKDVAAYADAQGDGYTREVLGLLLSQQVYAVAADKYHVEVTDTEVRQMLDQLIGANDPATFYSTAAQQGLSRADVFEAVRELQVLQGIAVEKGLLDLSDQALQKLYQQSLQQTVHLGYITVPDQATADAVLAQLTADPASYPQVAAQHAGPNTLSSVESRTADQIPGLLADGVRAAQPGTGFTLAVPQIGVVVAFVADPTFAQVRPDLVQQATVQSYPAALKLVTAVRDDLDLSVNPRYGVVQTAGELPTRGDVVQLAPGTCGVVRQAGAAADACSAESAAGN